MRAAAERSRQTPAVPSGYHSLTPRIFVDDVAKTGAFLKSTFDAVGDIEAERPSELRIGDSVLMISSTAEREAFAAFLYVYVDDADATYERAVAAGATTLEAPQDTPYGDRRAMVSDPDGNIFQIAHRLAG